MAKTITGSTSSSSWTFKLVATEKSTSTSNNNSVLVVEAFIGRTGSSSYMWGAEISCPISVTGCSKQTINYSNADKVTIDAGEWLKIGSKTFTVPHDSDGSKKITISAEFTNNVSPSSGEASGTMDLTKIPRYTSISTYAQDSKGLNWIKLKWATADTVDQVQYKIGSGSWVTASSTSAKSGTFQISSLNPNTTYSIKIRVRRKDSQLYTESSSLSITTYQIAQISSASNFNLGSNASVTITNPTSATASLAMKVGSTQILSKNLSTGANTISFTDAQLDAIYKLFGNSNSVTVSYTLTTNSNSSWKSTKSVTCTLTGNQKCLKLKVSGSWKRAKTWTKISGTWKRAVVWIKVSGSWKRSI